MRPSLQHITLDALAERTPKGKKALEMRENAQQMADNATAAIAAAARRAAGETLLDGSGAVVVEALAWNQLSESEARDLQRLARGERSRAEQLLRDAYDDILNGAQVPP